MRLRFLAISAILLAIVIGIWQWVFHGVHPALIIDPPPATVTHHPQLDVIESIDVDAVPMREILDELSAKHRFRYQIDSVSAQANENLVSLRIDDITLRSLLNRVVSTANDSWIAVDAGDYIRITTRDQWFDTRTNYITRFYPISPNFDIQQYTYFTKPPVVEPTEVALLGELIEQVIEPAHWESVGGVGSISAYPHGLLITTVPDVHVIIADLFEHLSALQDGATRAPIRLGQTQTNDREERLAERLRTRTDIVFEETTWEKLAEWLRVEHGIPVCTDASTAWLDFRYTYAKFQGNLTNIPLEDGLRLLLREFDLGFEIHNECLTITEFSPNDPVLVYKLYPISDLINKSEWGGIDFAEMITAVVAPETWDEVGGYGSCRYLGGCLVVAQREGNHKKLTTLIEELRSHTTPDNLTVPAEESESLARLLEQPATFKFFENTLSEIAAQLESEFGINVWVHAAGFEEIGFSRKQTFTLEANSPTLAQALDSLFAGTDSAWRVDAGHLVLTTPEVVDMEMQIRVYDLSALKAPVDASPTDVDALFDLITATLAPDTWEDVGGPGVLTEFGDLLVVSQSDSIHNRLRQFLTAIERAQTKSGQSRPIPAGEDEGSFWAAQQRLDEPLSKSITASTVLEAVEAIGAEVNIPIKFADAAIRDDSQFEMLSPDGITPYELRPGRGTVRSTLQRVLEMHGFAYSYRDGVLWIELDDDQLQNELWLYPTREYVDRDDLEVIAQYLQDWIDPAVWDDYGGRGSTRTFENVLVVSANMETHRKVTGLLEAIRDVTNSDDLAMRHVNLRMGAVSSTSVDRLRQPATSEESRRLLQHIFADDEITEDLTGLTLFTALHSPLTPRLFFDPDDAAFLRLRESVLGVDKTAEAETQLVIFPIDDLVQKYEQPRAPGKQWPWYLPFSEESDKGLATVSGLPAQPSLVADLVRHLYQPPWTPNDIDWVQEIEQIGSQLIVAADIGSIWQIEQILAGLRAYDNDQAFQWSKSHQAMLQKVSFDFTETNLHEITRHLREQVGFPVMIGNYIPQRTVAEFTGTGSATDVPLLHAFDHISFDNGLFDAKRLVIRPTSEALLVDVQDPPILSLAVYDIRFLNSSDTDLRLFNQLLSEVCCRHMSFGLTFLTASPHVEVLRGLASVEATKRHHQDVESLLALLQKEPLLLSALERSELDKGRNADLAAWIIKALEAPTDDFEQRLACWFVGQLPSVPAHLVKAMEDAHEQWRNPDHQSLLVSAVKRLGQQADGLMPLLIDSIPADMKDEATFLQLVDQVSRCTTHPLRDLSRMLEIVGQRAPQGFAIMRLLTHIGELGEGGRPLLPQVVELIPVVDNFAMDSSLRATIDQLDPSREELPKLINAWIQANNPAPERAKMLDVSQW